VLRFPPFVLPRHSEDRTISRSSATKRSGEEKPLARKTRQGHRKRLGWQYAELYYRLRTTDDPPLRQAWAIAMGTLVGCSPIWGLHIPICLFLCRIFRLSIVKATLASQISNPLFAPFLIFLEFGVGRWLLSGRFPTLSLTEVSSLGYRELGLSVVVGSLVVGVVLGAALGLVAFVIGLWTREPTFHRKLLDTVCRRYVNTGILHWEFVRGKLFYDRVYMKILREGLLPPEGTIVDLGCGRGILFSLLAAAGNLRDDPDWPSGWPLPGQSLVFRGIEVNSSLARTARRALRGSATVVRGDFRKKPIPSCNGVVLLDVLHHICNEEQEAILNRIANALEPRGILLIRETDVAAGWRFRLTSMADRLAGFRRWSLARRHHYRTAEQWLEVLRSHGYDPRIVPTTDARWYADILIEARSVPGEQLSGSQEP